MYRFLAVVLAATLIFGLTRAERTTEAASSLVTGGSLTWKVSQYAWTFSSLSQSHAVGAPATKDADNGFVFPASPATYNKSTGEVNIDFHGWLQLGNSSSGGYKIKLLDPSIVINTAGQGSLIADVAYCTGSGGTSPCTTLEAGFTTTLVENVTVVKFSTAAATITDENGHFSLTVTPDYPLQGDEAFPLRRQFPQSFIDSLAATLQSHFRDSGSGNDPNKPPAPLTIEFDYVAPVSQTVSTTILEQEDGALTLSVENPDVELVSPVLNGQATALESTGLLNSVTVSDQRLANPGWNVSGQVTNFVSSGENNFSGSRLGWTPADPTTSSGQTVTKGATVAPGAGASDGLAQPKTLGSAAAGQGKGIAGLGAELLLSVPTDTEPGEYTATITLTVI